VGSVSSKTHLNTLLKFEVIWAKGKPKLESDGISEGVVFPRQITQQISGKYSLGALSF
jgi:hypothetical protein